MKFLKINGKFIVSLPGRRNVVFNSHAAAWKYIKRGLDHVFY